MYCSKCGKKIGEQEKFCSYCGTKNERLVENSALTNDVIQKVKEGDESAFDTIYHQTYQAVWKITRSFFPEDKTECDDCIQDIYLNLYEKINYFDPEKGEFLPWLKRMAQNVCVNHYNKKKKINVRNTSLDAVTETEDSEKEKQFEDERLEFNPEAVMDKNETARLLQEILDELPLEQKQCLLLYYAAQYKQEVIAEMLGIPKGTVKSRLYNGKKLVEEKVLALEKRGTKLYSMSPIAFFIWLFAKDSEAQAANAAFAGISVLHTAAESIGTTAVETQAAAIAENTAASAVAKGTVSAGAKAAATKAVATKVIAGIVGAAVIGTGGYFAYDYYGNNKTEEVASNKSKVSVEETSTEVLIEEVEESQGLKEIVDQNLVAYVLKNLTGTEILQGDVETIVSKTAALQRSYLVDGVEIPDTYYISEEYVVGTDREDLVTDMPVGIVYKKEGFQELFDLLGAEYSWDDLSTMAMVSYQDEENVGFVGMGLGGSSEINVQINSMEENENGLKIYYEKSVQLIGMEPTINNFICTIVPEDNSIGYRIDSIQEDVSEVESEEYAYYEEVIDAYGKYFYNKEETDGILTEEIINQQIYGVFNPYTGYPFGVSEYTPEIYYAFVDINNDGKSECLFSSETKQNPEQLALYDIWTRTPSDKVIHLEPGAYRCFHAFCEDGTIMKFGSGGYDTGIYSWLAFDEKPTGIDFYTYDTENPFDETELNKHMEQHKIVDKNIQWTLIEPES